MSGITVGVPLEVYSLLCCDTSRVMGPSCLCPEGSPTLIPCWILSGETGNVTVTPGHWVLPWFFLHSCCSSRSFRASQAKKDLQAPSGVAMPLCCLYVFPACLFTLAVLVWMLCLGTAFPGMDCVLPGHSLGAQLLREI